MDIGSTIVAGLFILLTAFCIGAAKSVFAVSSSVAFIIGVPTAFAIGMLLIWLLGKFSGSKRK
jgi:ABC-type Mn2+/Zn2+ transport system permease subunit